MSCSVAVEPQPSASGLPPVVYTTVVPFTNYSQWERRPKAPEAIKKAVSGKTRTKSKAQGSSGKSTIHCHRHTTSNEQSIIVSSRPQDDRKKFVSSVKTRTISGTQPSRSESATRLRLLRMAVATTKVSMEDLKHHKEKLFSINLSLMHNIKSSENCVHTDVDRMLEKYTSFKGTLSKLQTKAGEELEKAKEDLQMTTANLEADISELHTKVINTERLVRKKSRELNVLLNYKDKEFPMKCMKIEQLREQCEVIGEENEAELEEVEQQIAEEWDKHRQAMEDVKRDLTTQAAQASLATMKKSVHEKAVQNRIMNKELILHERKRYELEDSIASLKANIKRLSEELERKTHSRHKPALSTLGKCLPNTELQLDFPRQQQLPF